MAAVLNNIWSEPKMGRDQLFQSAMIVFGSKRTFVPFLAVKISGNFDKGRQSWNKVKPRIRRRATNLQLSAGELSTLSSPGMKVSQSNGNTRRQTSIFLNRHARGKSLPRQN